MEAQATGKTLKVSVTLESLRDTGSLGHGVTKDNLDKELNVTLSDAGYRILQGLRRNRT